MAWDHTHLPAATQSQSSLPAIDRTFVPTFEYRDVDGWSALSHPQQAKYFHMNGAAQAHSASSHSSSSLHISREHLIAKPRDDGHAGADNPPWWLAGCGNVLLLLAPFCAENRMFAKAGSGQTYAKLKQRHVSTGHRTRTRQALCTRATLCSPGAGTARIRTALPACARHSICSKRTMSGFILTTTVVYTGSSAGRISHWSSTCSGECICNASEIQTGWSPRSERPFER